MKHVSVLRGSTTSSTYIKSAYKTTHTIVYSCTFYLVYHVAEVNMINK